MSFRILIVDDSQWMRQTLINIFAEQGWRDVVEARHGREGLMKYEDVWPHLVMMDITMPYMDGVEAAKAILQIDPRAVIIMCSALGQRDTVIEAIRAGARGFVVKPFRREDVIDAVQKVMPKA